MLKFWVIYHFLGPFGTMHRNPDQSRFLPQLRGSVHLYKLKKPEQWRTLTTERNFSLLTDELLHIIFVGTLLNQFFLFIFLVWLKRFYCILLFNNCYLKAWFRILNLYSILEWKKIFASIHIPASYVITIATISYNEGQGYYQLQVSLTWSVYFVKTSKR